MKHIHNPLKHFIIAAIFVAGMVPVQVQAQEEAESQAPVKKSKPVRSPWAGNSVIESQSYLVFPKKTVVFDIQHRFGVLNSTTFDLFGLYAPSNIRMGLTYVVMNNLQLGIGTTKNNKLQDFNWKYSILEQTRSNSIPIAITYYGMAQYSMDEKEQFGEEYKASHRMSYFNQLIIGRKFGSRVSIQLMGNYAHYNQIDTAGLTDFKHDNLGVGFAGRFKFSPQGSIIIEYDYPLTTPENIKPNASFAVEFGTSSHVFQLFVTTYSGINYSKNLMYNTNDFTKGDVLIGFNITRNWSF